VALYIQISTNNYPNDPLLIGFTILKSCISGTWNIEHTQSVDDRGHQLQIKFAQIQATFALISGSFVKLN